MKDVFLELRRWPNLLERANQDIVMLIINSMDASNKCETAAIDAVTNLLEENLISQSKRLVEL